MNPSSKAKGQRTTLSLSILLLLVSAVGGYTVFTILNEAKRAAYLAEAIVPQAELSGNMLSALDKARLANRTYAITQQESYKEEGIKHMNAFDGIYTQAVQLSAAHPNLTVLKEILPSIKKAREDYGAQVRATDDNLTQRSKIIDQLNTNAPITLTALNNLTSDQDRKMRDEISSGLAGEKLEERRQKVLMANDLLDKINSIREISYKAQSEQKPELLDTTTPLFNEMDLIMQKLRPMLLDPANLKQLDVVSQKIVIYKEGAVALAKNLSSSQIINESRLAAGVELDSLLNRLDQKANDRTFQYSNSSSSGLSLVAKLLIGLLVVLIGGGLAAAYFVIRGINQSLKAKSTAV